MAKDRIGWLLLPDMSWLNRSVTIKMLFIIAALVAAAIGAFIAVGGVPIAANEPDGWLTRNLLHFTFKRSIAESARSVTPPADLHIDGRVRLGARQFDMVCANCHGAPGIGQSAVALSMSPRPQHLPRVIDQFTDEELFIIVQHGVKFSAMPSWPNDTRHDEVWSMVAFLRQLPKMDATTYLDLTTVKAPETVPEMPLGDVIALRPSDTDRNAPPTNEFLYAAPAVGFSDRTLRTRPVALCAGCHGEAGDGAATKGEAPNLTIQDSAYLRNALDAYSRGSRKSGFMQEIASQLSTQQLSSLADYYAKLPVKTLETAATADPQLVKRGETIALNGTNRTAIAACVNCHESAGARITNAPHIAGQNATYLRRQLTAMRLGGRGSTGTWNPMYSEAHDLTDDDIAGLAAYYSGLKPLKAGGALMAAAWPAGDAAKGKPIFDQVCLKCHLNEGRGDDAGSFPDIRLHAAPYVVQQLHSFRARIRDNIKMIEVTEALSYDDIKNVAAYLNSLSPEPAVASFDKAAAARGAAIAENGSKDRNVPACLSCHGKEGVNALPLIPRLQGQSAPYLHARLDWFAKATGGEVSALNPMPMFASKLTPQERGDLAAYFAAQVPVEKAAAK